MASIFKKLARSTARRFGYELVKAVPGAGAGTSDSAFPRERYRQIAAELSEARILRDIHKQDAVEVEELFRHFVFKDLPRRADRSSLLGALIGTTVAEAIYIVQYLHEALRVPGDVCEFGVAQGATSCLLAAELGDDVRQLWLFDSFEGLPEPGPEDELIDDIFKLGSMRRYKGTMASPESEVLSKLDRLAFPRARTRVKKGWIKDTLKDTDQPAHVAFAYVDLDLYEPIRDALDFIDGRMPPGGRIVVDDYGFFSAGAQLAVDQFVAGTNGRFKFEKPLPLAGHFCMLSKLA
jgi:O-methyltransferase